MFLIVIGILSIILAFQRPLYDGLHAPRLVISAVAIATMLPALIAWMVNRRVVWLLERKPETPGDGQFALGRGLTIVQAVLGVSHAALLLGTDWMLLCGQLPMVGAWPVVPGLLATLPFLLALSLVWIVTYPADRAVRQIALEVNIFRGKPVRPVWTVGQHLLFNLRHQVLFILIPMFLILAARDVITIYSKRIVDWAGHERVPDLLLGATAGLVAVIAPVILRWVWVTQDLPGGPLRDRLELMCKQLRLRCRAILVWRSGGVIVNAAVMGLIGPLRYILITEAMLEQMEDRKIEAVFGHEAGHVKRHHILFFLLFALISGCLVTVLTARTSPGRAGPPIDRAMFQIIATIGGVVLLLKWGLLFGWISRRFERQADVFGARTLALSGVPCSLPCALHAPSEIDSAGTQAKETFVGRALLGRRAPLCSTAANIFSDALHDVAVLNGIPPESRSWRHSSIASRSRFLQKLAGDPGATRRFERLVSRIQWGIFLGAVLSALWAAWEIRLWTVLGRFWPGNA